MSYRHIFLLTIIILTMSLAALAWLNTSPWLIWHLLPAAPQRIVTAPRHPAIRPLQPLFDQYVWPTLELEADVAARLGLARDGSQTTLILLPTLTKQLTLAPQLTQAGWQVQRIGLLLYAQSSAAPAAPPVRRALTAALKDLTASRLPLIPALIAAQAAAPQAEPQALVATGTAGTLSLITVPDFSSALPNHPPPSVPADTQLTAQLPGHLLSQLPVSLRDAWDEELRRRFAFTHTRPPLIDYLSQFNTIHITLTATDASLTVSGAVESAQATITKWIQDEERARRPVQRAFRLPDGTLGYEEVPGEPAPVFQTDQQPCAAPLSDRTSLWLCRDGERTTLTSSETLARRPAPDSDTLWYLALTPHALAACQENHARDFCQFTAASFVGTATQSVGQLTFTSAQ